MPYKSRKRKWSTYVRGITHAAKFGYKAVSAYNRFKRRKTDNNDNVITTNHEIEPIYKRKKMPWRKKKRWVAFKKKVQWVNASAQPRNTLVYTNTDQLTCAANEQAVLWCPIYSAFWNGGFDMNRDIYRCASVAFQSGVLADQKAGAKLNFHSALMELTLMNKSTDPIYCDVYWMYAKKDEKQDFGTLYADGIFWNDNALDGDENATSVVGTQPGINTLGITPFQSSKLMRQFKCYKKKRILLGSNSTIQLQMRRPRNFVYTMDGRVIDELWPISKHTAGFCIQAYKVPDEEGNVSKAIAVDELLFTRYVNYFFTPVDAGAKRRIAVGGV